MTTLNKRKVNVNINMSTERKAKGNSLGRIPDDILVSFLERINNWKNYNTWNILFNCIHVDEDQEYIIEFGESDWILCDRCVQRLAEFLYWMDNE